MIDLDTSSDSKGARESRYASVRTAFGVLVGSAIAVGATVVAEALVALWFGGHPGRTLEDILIHPAPWELWHRLVGFLLFVAIGTAAVHWRRRGRDQERAFADFRHNWEREQASSESQLRLAAEVFENTIEGIVVTDPEGTIQTVNPAFTAITGYSAEEAIGQNPRILKSDRHPPEFYKAMWQALETKGQWSGEIWNRHKSGRAYPEWLTISAIRGRTGKVTSFVSVFHDLSDLKQREEEMHYLAHHDPLTGLANRLLFDDHLRLAVAQARRSSTSLAVIYADLDDFKEINDHFGHVVGDQVLQEIASRLTDCVREEDTVARLGGDEFVLILPGLADLSLGRRVMDCIRTAVARPMTVGDHVVEASFSIGAAFFPDHGHDADTLVRNADFAMYHAKGGGKNRAVSYDEALRVGEQSRNQPEEDRRSGPPARTRPQIRR